MKSHLIIDIDAPKRSFSMGLYTVRQYNDSDFPMIATWWELANEQSPNENMLPKESTFILEISGIPAYCASAYLTNTLEVCYFENFIKSPFLKPDHDAANHLMDYMFNQVKSLGYKRVVALSHKDKLKKRYQEFGFKETLDNLTAFVKELN